MILLDFLFGKSNKMKDDFFGTMNFIENKKYPENSYFECRRHFEPMNEFIEIGIDGDISGPTIEQKQFFKKIETEYNSIVNSISPVIEEEFRNWKEDFKIENFKTRFRPVYLKLPRYNGKSMTWEIAFESDHDLNHTFTVSMNELKAKEVHIDG